MPPPSTPSDFVRHCHELAATRPDAVAYTWLHDGEDEESSLTFGELDLHARKIAAHLEDRGLRGSRVLLIYSPGLEFVAAFVGCLYAGVVAVPLNAPRNAQTAATLLGIVRHAAPALALTDAALLEATAGQRKLFGPLEFLATDGLSLAAGEGWRPRAVAPDDLAFLKSELRDATNESEGGDQAEAGS